MRNILMAATAGLLLAVGAAGLADASSDASPHYATGVSACLSKSSPILDDHYGYDDRVCPKMTEGRAGYVDEGSSRTR
jgi:hypothetical protein